MKTLIFGIFFSIIGVLSFANAEPGISDLCKKIQIRKSVQAVGNQKIVTLNILDLMDLLFHKSQSIGIAEYRNGMLDSISESKAIEASEIGHQILLFTPDHKDFPSSDESLHYVYWKYTLADMNRAYLQPLFKQQNIEDCLAEAQRIDFTDKKLNAFNAMIRGFVQVRNKIYAKSADKITHDIAEMNPSIKLIEISTYEDIVTSVRRFDQDSNTQKIDLVFLFHGGADGALEDLGGLMIPPSFFEELSQSQKIKSISIYACFPQRVVDYYKEPFIHLTQNGVRIFLGVNIGVLRELEPVDLNSFKYFMEKDLQNLNHY